MLSTASRQRAEACIRRALPAGQSPWEALDRYRARGGHIGWQDWFRLWRRIATGPAPEPSVSRYPDRTGVVRYS